MYGDVNIKLFILPIQFRYKKINDIQIQQKADLQGQLGLGESKTYLMPRVCSFCIVIDKVSCGFNHTAFITNDKILYMTGFFKKKYIFNQYYYIINKGSNNFGQLGIGQQNLNNSFQPQLVEDLFKIKKVSCGHSFTLSLTANGQLYGFGNNQLGQLGTGDFENKNKQTKVKLEKKIRKIKCGYYHTLILDENNLLYTCGQNDEGQLGLGHKNQNICIPTMLQIKQVWKIAAGQYSGLITENGELYLFECF
ncbi:regulator of chromosome condensation, putative [Ichthyophthirius multifiliis]|uniref:Regulator of chromosome condensation, putative n=1 Tax=Ichthyophthirius multifiliis TaxID=5932 RepID=G0QXQ9_ICHMU|nr:regulator of chromosome condensation, putative [Ichthyophthirius multifiliis]EGR29996.1 regulator of chromosome condensation, putative [Ichthyophthirius multifiliis]|eukprot:XP_004031232.1 regulator of chromosome condensation, putative [Ichthyophthirius multifiliis]